MKPFVYAVNAYEEVLAKPELKGYLAAVERIMVQLIVPGAGKEDTRQIVAHDRFSAEDRGLLPVLAGQRLVITRRDSESGVDTVEVIHEALIREWVTFRGWVEKHRGLLVWQERLRERKADWEEHEQVNEGLLTGRYLLEAQEYLTSNKEMLSEKDKKFIKLSSNVARRQSRTRQSVITSIIGVIGVVATVAVWQWQLALDAEALAFSEAEKAKVAEQHSKDEADKARESEAKAELAAKQAFNSEKLAKQETEKAQQSEQETTALANATMDYLVIQNMDFVKGFVKHIADKDLTSPLLSLLKPYISESKSMDSQERNYWEQVLPVMTEEQRIELLNISFTERKELYDINIKYGALSEADYISILEKNSEDINATMGYAKLLRQEKKYDKAERYYEQAEKLYQQAIKADPQHANNLSDFARFMTDIRKDYDQAEKLYQQAIKADPQSANNLGNFALFMKNIRKDYDQAEKLYQQAIKADPQHANNLGNFASFMKNIRKDYDQAEKLYQQAIKADPQHANNLGNFALFRKNIRKDYDQAEKLYQQAIKADPQHASAIGNYAQLKLGRGNFTEGKVLLNKSFIASGGEDKVIELELWFYRLAHFLQEHPNAQSKIIELLKQDVRSDGWDFSGNIEQAKKQNHPNIPLLQALANVISNKAEFDTLKPFLQETETATTK